MRRLIKIIRNILLLAITGIIVLAGVLMFNVVTRGSRQLQVAAVPRAAVDARRGGAAERGDPVPDHLEFSQPGARRRGAARLAGPHRKSFPAFHAAAKREVVGRL